MQKCESVSQNSATPAARQEPPEVLRPLARHLPAALAALAEAQAAPGGGGARCVDAAACVQTSLWLLEAQVEALGPLLLPEALRELDRELTLNRALAYALGWGVAARGPPESAARDHVSAVLLEAGLNAEAGLPAGCGLLDFALDTSAEALAASKKAELPLTSTSPLTLTLSLTWTTT